MMRQTNMKNPEQETAGQTRILVAVAELPLCRRIVEAAKGEGYTADDAADGITALKLIRRNAYQLFVLDVNLPELNGLLVCKEIRTLSSAPIILIGSLSSEEDRLAGFLAGGNDYLVKPVFTRELMARIRSFLSLAQNGSRDPELLTAGGICIDNASRCVYVDRGQVQLTPREYDLLCFLCKNPHHAFSRDILLDRVWGWEFAGSYRTVDTHVRSLREKIRPYQDYIVTVWGYGYKLEV